MRIGNIDRSLPKLCLNRNLNLPSESGLQLRICGLAYGTYYKHEPRLRFCILLFPSYQQNLVSQKQIQDSLKIYLGGLKTGVNIGIGNSHAKRPSKGRNDSYWVINHDTRCPNGSQTTQQQIRRFQLLSL